MKIYDVLKVSNSKYISLLVRGFDSREFTFPKYIPRYPIVLKCIGGVFFKGFLSEKSGLFLVKFDHFSDILSKMIPFGAKFLTLWDKILSK